MNTPAPKRTCNISHQVSTHITKTGFNRTVESIETRKERRQQYTIVLVNLLKSVHNCGFTLADFEHHVSTKNLQDITLHRHNDLVETLTSAAHLCGIILFRNDKDTYYVDDIHAQYWGLNLRPRDSIMAAGSERGLRMMLKKGDYIINGRVKKFSLQKNLPIDSDVAMYINKL